MNFESVKLAINRTETRTANGVVITVIVPGVGDTLEQAFDKVNRNFAIITLGVTAAAGHVTADGAVTSL